jgi:hypothetical protein
MATYADEYTAARTNTIFLQRIAISLVKAAIAISSEATGTANHANRVALAKAVVNSPDNFATLFAVGITGQLAVGPDPTIITDAQIDGQVSGIWNTYAGVV